jgi:hypothetical protein
VTQLYPADIDLESDEINLEDVCATQWAAYKQALDTVIDVDPGRHRLNESAQAAGFDSGPVNCAQRYANSGNQQDER